MGVTDISTGYQKKYDHTSTQMSSAYYPADIIGVFVTVLLCIPICPGITRTSIWHCILDVNSSVLPYFTYNETSICSTVVHIGMFLSVAIQGTLHSPLVVFTMLDKHSYLRRTGAAVGRSTPRGRTQPRSSPRCIAFYISRRRCQPQQPVSPVYYLQRQSSVPSPQHVMSRCVPHVPS